MTTEGDQQPPARPDFSREDRAMGRVVFFGMMLVLVVLLGALALPHLRGMS